jgi:uncharacterized membrane protein
VRIARATIRHRLFTLGVAVKGIDGLLESVGGLVLLLTSARTMNAWVVALTHHELAEDPRDLVANFLLNHVAHLSADTRLFGAAYLLVHGAVKIFLVAGLLTNKRWSYPTALAVLGAFMLYQLYRFSYTHSIWLAAVTVVDLIVVVLIYEEYRAVRCGYRRAHAAELG